MKMVAITALALVAVCGASAAHAQSGRGPSVPSQFHGRWAENQQACRPQHFTSVITVNRRGWSSFEEGGNVTRVGQIRNGTHYFRLDNYNGGEESQGSLAMRRDSARLVMSFQVDGSHPVHHTLVRCR